MKNLKTSVKSTTKKIANGMMKKDFYAWPTPCIGIFHQPQKPKAIPKK